MITRLGFAVALLWAILSPVSARGYSWNAHRNVTKHAVQNSDLGPADQLLNVTQILDCRGTDTVADNNRTAAGWVREGAIREDDWGFGESASVRFRNHFYNPLNGQGLSYFGFVVGNPAPDWALDDNAQYDQQLYSLRRAHDYYYASLTAASPDTRTQQLALTYCTLGHVMHLIEDMASPQHTRNDSHGTYSAYEKYTDGGPVVDSLPFDGYPVVYGARDRATFNSPRNLWHTTEEQVRDRKGLADYSNRGFVTEGTNFTTNPPLAPIDVLFPAPGLPDPSGAGVLWQAAIETLTPCKWRDPEFQPHGLLGFVQTTVHDAYTNTDDINAMTSTESVFDPDLDLLSQPKTFSLNCYTFEAAQNLLIPRAVGYSAGLLNYFFRGFFALYGPNNFENNPGEVDVLNYTGEEMNGTFEIYYDDAQGTRHPVGTAQSEEPVPPHGSTPLKTFVYASDPAVSDYVVVFRGTLGSETDAVAVTQPHVPSNPIVRVNAPSAFTASDAQNDLASYEWGIGCWHDLGPPDYGFIACPVQPSDGAGSLSGGRATVDFPSFDVPTMCDECGVSVGVTDGHGHSGGSFGSWHVYR